MKSCQVPNCNYPVWGKGFCKFHQHLRPDKKPKKSAFISTRQKKSFDFGFESQPDLFAWLWNNAKNKKGEVICKFTGEKLNRFYGTDLWFSCFAHVLPKGRYTYFRLNPKNVECVFPDFHHIADQGTSVDRANHPDWKFSLWDKRKEELKIEYELFKKQNLLA